MTDNVTRSNSLLVLLCAGLSLALALVLSGFGATAYAEENADAGTEETAAVEQSSDDPEGTDCPNSWRYTDGVLDVDEPDTVGLQSVTSSGHIAMLIDVSKWDGTINWAKVKKDNKNIKYAIIRCGFGSNKSSQDDSKFLANVKGALNNGIQVGVYLYSYAYTNSMASSEADHVLRLLKKAGLTTSKMTLPVYYDLEEQAGKSYPCVKASGKYHKLSNKLLGTMAATFCNKISKQGYQVGIYANRNWWNNFLTASQFKNSSWSKWVAEYSSKCRYDGKIDIWQYSSKGKVNGISTYVDMNYVYRDFENKTTTADVTLTGYSYPETLTAGNDYDIAGTLTSTAAMSRVKVEVKNSDGTSLSGAPTASASPNAKSFSLSSLNESLSFSSLKAGTYRYCVSVTIEDTTETILDKQFTVEDQDESDTSTDPDDLVKFVTASAPITSSVAYTKPKFKLTYSSSPSAIKVGSKFTFKGKITSSVKMTSLTATIKNSSGETVASWSVNPSAKSYKLSTSSIASKLKTSALEKGKYTYRLVAKSSSASKTLVSKTFTVGPAAPSISKLTKGKKKFTAYWSSVADVSGYQICYSRYKSMKSPYYVTVNSKTTAKKVSVKKSKHYYYVKIRSYVTIDGTKCYGSWSSVKRVKTK